jgi:hypothetical protein
MPALRMSASRLILVMLALLAVVALAGCGLSGSGGSHGAAWHQGYDAGTAARAHHKFQRGATRYDITAFCVKAAVSDIRTVKSSVVQWTEGFERSCSRRA